MVYEEACYPVASVQLFYFWKILSAAEDVSDDTLIADVLRDVW